MPIARSFFFFLLLLLTNVSFAQRYDWITIEPQTDASFRALSVVDDSTAWVAGTKGWVGRTTNGGKDWIFSQVKNFETFDFRSLYAFDKNFALIANAGAPANILYTSDGGVNWRTVYTNNDTSAFFDGIDFWNKSEGLIYGDPIKGKMLMLKTSDGGLTWKEIPAKSRPALMEGEASFAASGSNIRCYPASTVIATGGKKSRLWFSKNKGMQWSPVDVPILQGESSRGIFSVAFYGEKNGLIVGGDYLQDTLRTDHVFYTRDGGKTWKAPQTPTRGYRECVEYITSDLVVTTGPTGTDVSIDGGANWSPESDDKYFHVVRKARKGKLIIAAGGRGKISILKDKP